MWPQHATEMEWKLATSFSPWQMWGSTCYPCERSYSLSLQALWLYASVCYRNGWFGGLINFYSILEHRKKVVNKANTIVGFLKRNVGPGNKEVVSRLYKASVIPILEYAIPLWSPYLQKNIDLNESNVGPRNTLSRCHLGTLRTKKDCEW